MLLYLSEGIADDFDGDLIKREVAIVVEVRQVLPGEVLLHSKFVFESVSAIGIAASLADVVVEDQEETCFDVVLPQHSNTS